MLASLRKDRAIKDRKPTIPANRKVSALPHASTPERGPVLAWRNAQAALERAAKYLSRGKATGNRYLLKTHRSRFDLTARCLNAEVLDVSRWRPAHLLLKQAGEIPGTHGGTSGETFDGEITPDVVRKPREQIIERRFRRNLGHESGAELRLTAWPPQKHHHHLSSLKCDCPAQILFH
jgi:hypothetical protein